MGFDVSGVDQQRRRKNKPREINDGKNCRDHKIKREGNQDPAGTEDDAQDSPHNRVVLVERLEEIAERYAERESAVNVLEKIYEVMKNIPRAVDVPVVEKIPEAVEEAVQNINQSKVHISFIIAGINERRIGCEFANEKSRTFLSGATLRTSNELPPVV